jgi:hypothetical protein
MNDAVTIATIVLAIVAALAFGVSLWQTIESRKSIETATKATEAAVRQAIATEKLLDETLVNRELDWRPMLVWERVCRQHPCEVARLYAHY